MGRLRTLDRVLLTIVYAFAAVCAGMLASFMGLVAYALWLMEALLAGVIAAFAGLLACTAAGCFTWLVALTWRRRA
jgi:hypothetical protein